MRKHFKGFTLVELMVAVALFALLFTFAYPSYTDFIRNAQIRTVAESVVNGLQLARAEAIRRNSNIQFHFPNTSNSVSTTGGTDWSISSALSATPTNFNQAIQTRRENSGSSNARIGVANSTGTAAAAGAGMPADIMFTGMGRLNGASAVRRIDVTGAAGARALAILLAPGGDVRLCDPALSLATNPQGCS
ncbi:MULTISPECIES: GspH/FimT family pseudopilin [unclassified Variovorax]|jgi:type IV fimbrial biogenesis protein FimT|uniref:GspH/FimT family pseudopilin n=1 Tax=unclassified Variovorax TaxID=663243 RepID=UPI0015A5ED82|nr:MULTISPECIES: GspH/FimT family pseudopilin [unclassified Variovorax]